jgi:hypothetical protein
MKAVNVSNALADPWPLRTATAAAMILRQRCLLIGQWRRTLTGEFMDDQKNEEKNPGDGRQEKSVRRSAPVRTPVR